MKYDLIKSDDFFYPGLINKVFEIIVCDNKNKINDMINYGYETTDDQKEIILQFCDLEITQNSNSESISKSESDAILKLIDDVDNSLNNYSDTLIDSEESNSNSNCSSNIIN